MKPFRWSPTKNDLLKQERGVSFEEITVAVEAGGLLEIVLHQNPAKYPRQRIMVVEVAGYAFLVPFVEEEDHFFLKTIIPSRKATRDFIAKESDDV
ncbi:BrnT family toxin [Methyloversatilis sp.]|uniref:BrnT family toxin n=1 Tax=Methyloversatilis sp. TaxID=2569862 RepID=UPI002735E3F0|nr:BrnT family toxin [Methyloversatilis sp.]MDP2869996.1 BrnT family toxin [Methyloversatilis sp.]MDP3455410.1 BrnT family toxin [Methyloversatilis sp.]MDP3578523.1 BrnT family toxin [Methyloversatilis sp.]